MNEGFVLFCCVESNSLNSGHPVRMKKTLMYVGIIHFSSTLDRKNILSFSPVRTFLAGTMVKVRLNWGNCRGFDLVWQSCEDHQKKAEVVGRMFS